MKKPSEIFAKFKSGTKVDNKPSMSAMRFRDIKFPGFKILDRYITRRFLGTFFFAISLIIVVVVVFDAAEKIDNFIEKKAPLKAIIVDYYLNFVPYFINMFCGLFTFISVIFFTSKMAYQTEIIAILSSGVSFKRLMWPYFISATVITIISLYLNLFLIPVANTKRVEFEAKYVNRSAGAQYEPQIYRQIYPGTFAYIRNYSNANQRASYLSIEEYEGSKIVSTLEAADVTFDPVSEHWTADKYIERRFDENGKETFERFDNLDTTINLSVVELGKVEDLITTMSISKLSTFIDQQKSKGSDMIAYFEVERQRRYSYPLSTFILTLIGVSLSSRKVRGGTGLHIGIGITLCFSYIMISRVAEEIAKGGAMFPGLLVWVPNIVFAIIAVFIYHKAPK